MNKITQIGTEVGFGLLSTYLIIEAYRTGMGYEPYIIDVYNIIKEMI